MLAQAPCPVYILPGNHDPASSGSVWEDDCWAAAQSVFLLLRNQPVEISGGTLYRCPALAPDFGRRPHRVDSALLRFRLPDLGLRTARCGGHVEMEPCYPIPVDAADRLQLDYLALGHNHSTATYDGGSGVVRMAYSGTHEPTKFGERNSGNVLLVDIDAPGAAPRIDTIPSHVLDWQTLDRSVRCAADLTAVAAELEHSATLNTYWFAACSRARPAIQDDDLERLAETIDSRFLFGELDREGLEINIGGGRLGRGSTGRLSREVPARSCAAARRRMRLRPRPWRNCGTCGGRCDRDSHTSGNRRSTLLRRSDPCRPV